MFKLFNKKLNKKGFTLAELLVVVAIIAILIAIAVPIFTKSMREAQLRTNQANMRSVKAAGVTQILSDWGTYSKASFDTVADSSKTTTTPVPPAQTWCITAKVDAKGNISDVAVSGIAEKYNSATHVDVIATTTGTGFPADGAVCNKLSLKNALGGSSSRFADLTGIGDTNHYICNVSADTNQSYAVLVYVSDVDFKTS